MLRSIRSPLADYIGPKVFKAINKCMPSTFSGKQDFILTSTQNAERMVKKIIFLSFLVISSCKQPTPTDKSVWIEEIHQAERAFNKMAAEQGVQAAFLAFAADSAALNRNNRIIRGKAAIREYFEQQTLRKVRLSWEPQHIDVSDDGSMGYTYGPYTFSARDTSGRTLESTGIFHTVWKRQDNGTWKYVYD